MSSLLTWSKLSSSFLSFFLIPDDNCHLQHDRTVLPFKFIGQDIRPIYRVQTFQYQVFFFHSIHWHPRNEQQPLQKQIAHIDDGMKPHDRFFFVLLYWSLYWFLNWYNDTISEHDRNISTAMQFMLFNTCVRWRTTTNTSSSQSTTTTTHSLSQGILISFYYFYR